MTPGRAGVLAALALACTYDNPNRCDFQRARPGDCRAGLVCDESNLCVPPKLDAAAVPSRDAAPRVAATDAAASGITDAEGDAPAQVDASGDATLAADVPVARDVPQSRPLDARAPPRDATLDLRFCADDRECPAANPVCTGTACIRCRNDSDCDLKPGKRCDATSGRCVACVTSPHCPWHTPICTTNNVCTACNAPGVPSTACATRDPNTPMCKADRPNGICVGCTSSLTDCNRAGLPICDGQPAVCRACASNGECAARSNITPYCVPARGCFTCLVDANCPDPARPACSPGGACVPCTKDEQCAARYGPNPGLCLDGRCASDAEAVYVDNRTGCSDTGTGTAATPFCQPQPAVDAALAVSKRLVVLRGSAALQGFSATVPSGTLSVIGTGTSTLRGGATAVVHVRGGDLHLRGVRVREAAGVGVLVDPAGSLRLNRAELSYNAGGGLHINGGGYDVTNTVVSWNGNQTSCDPNGFGVYLVAGASKTARFVNNTLLGNCGYGLRCTAAVGTTGVLAFNNTTTNLDPTCGGALCCTGDPMLSGDRLTANSRQCIDVLDPAQAPPDDLTGAVRPIGVRSDCGAHEYAP
jgi:hypothetical protein